MLFITYNKKPFHISKHYVYLKRKIKPYIIKIYYTRNILIKKNKHIEFYNNYEHQTKVKYNYKKQIIIK
ncbi:hypothetical protein PFUGPA_00397 [Plasmodium falciparum Palo Alto/Uganda]|uniref:Uncharacterized protein n=1 Tax=Plasmodium falciparum (isolate Palo Alto / Uganda) TaxID=57270 RepID=W4J5E9_PLAFP|nr:hypothetical protein PFUGPA_00397 [Plasmodium falciparum Palo Alto/Uganda]